MNGLARVPDPLQTMTVNVGEFGADSGVGAVALKHASDANLSGGTCSCSLLGADYSGWTVNPQPIIELIDQLGTPTPIPIATAPPSKVPAMSGM